MKKTLYVLVFLLLGVALVLSACSDKGEGDGDVTEATKYKITFVCDGEVFHSYEAEKGAAVSFPKDAPENYEDDTYVYEFAGWSRSENGETVDEGEKVTSDITYYAVFDATDKEDLIPKYTVIFVDGLTGETIDTVSVPKGEAAQAPSAPVHEGYTFTGWDKPFDKITARTEITAEYSRNEYTFTVVDCEGSFSETVYYGDEVSPGSATSVYGLVFDGWYTDKDYTVTFESVCGDGMPAKDVTVYAKYSVDLTDSAINFPTYAYYGGTPVSVNLPDYRDPNYSGDFDDIIEAPEIVKYTYLWSDGSTEATYPFKGSGLQTVGVTVTAVYDYEGVTVTTVKEFSGECNVAKASLDVTVTFAESSVSYGTAPEPIFEVKGFVGDDEVAEKALLKAVYTSLGTEADGDKLPVGQYLVSVDGSALKDYEVGSRVAYFTVTRALLDVGVEFDKDAYVYGDEVAVTPVYSGFKYGESADDLTVACSVAHTGNTELNGLYSAGEHSFVAVGGVSESYEFRYTAEKIDVSAAPLTVMVSSDKSSYVYGETPVVSYSVDGFVADEDESALGGSVSYVYSGGVSDSGFYSAGKHSVCAEGFVSVNYNINYIEADFAVLKAELTGKVIIADSDNFVYGDMLRLSLELTGFVGDESLATLGISPVYTVVAGDNIYSPTDKLHAGSYSVNASMEEPANYTVVSIESAPLTIGKKTLTVTLSTDKESYVYGETVTPVIEFEGFAYGEDAASAGCVTTVNYYDIDMVAYERDVFTVNIYSAMLTAGSAENYTWKAAWATNDFNVVKKSATVTVATDKSEYVYGEKVSTSFSYDGLVYGDTPEEAFGNLYVTYMKDGAPVTDMGNAPDAGTYTVSANATSVPANYELTVSGNEFVINEREFVIRINAVSASESGWSKSSDGFETVTLGYGTFYVDGTLNLNATERGLYTATGSNLTGTEFAWADGFYIRLGNVGGRNVTDNFEVIYDISVNLIDKSFEGVNISIKGNNLVYNGNAQELGDVSVDNAISAVITYSLTENGEYTSSAPTAVSAGEYIVYYKVTAPGYAGAIEGSYKAVIAQAVNKIVQIADGDYVYNGTEQTVDVDAVAKADFGEITITEGSNVFTFVPANGYLVFTVSVAGTENYTSAQYELRIPVAKAEITLTAEDVMHKYDGSYAGADVNVIISGNYADDTVFNYSYVYGGAAQADPYAFVNAGTYSVTCLVTSVNYADASVTYSVIVEKGDFGIEISDEIFVYNGSAQGNAVRVAEDASLYAIKYYYNGILYTGEGAPAYVNAGTYDIRCVVTSLSANYANAEKNYSITISRAKNKITVIDGASFGSYTYNGELQSVNYLSVLHADFGRLTVTSGNDSFVNVPVGGVHRFTVGVVGTVNYEACSYEVAVNVAKANYTHAEIPADAVKSDDIVMRLGRKLSFVELSAGFSWVNPDDDLTSGSHSAYYCGDSVNYNVYEVTVNVVARKENVMLSVSENIEADYGVTRLDGLVSVTATGEGRTLTDDEAALVYTISTNADYTVGGTYTVSYLLKENDYYEVRFDGRAGSEFVTSFKIRSVKVGSVSYTIEDALFAASSGTVIVTADTTFATASVKDASGGLYANTAYYTVKSGVTLLLPYSVSDNTGNNAAYDSNTPTSNPIDLGEPYVKLIVPVGIVIYNNGTVNVGALTGVAAAGMVCQGKITGGYAQVDLSGKIISNGQLNVYGEITGAGSLDITGGRVRERMEIPDWRGGTIASAVFMGNASVSTVSLLGTGEWSPDSANEFPFKQYELNAIKSEMTVHSGASYSGIVRIFTAAANYASIVSIPAQFTTVDFNIIGSENGNDGMLRLRSGAYAVKVWKASGVDLTLSGGAIGGVADIRILLIKKEIVVDTGRIAFPISGNMNITLLDGDYASDYAYKLLPGAQLTVGNGATLTLNNKFVVYKESDIVYSGTNEKYPSGMGDAVLQIGNGGTLIINGAFGGKVTGNGGATVRVGNSAQMSASVTEGTGSKEVSITTVDFIYTVTSTINNTAQLISGDGSVADMQTGVVYKYNGATWVVS